MPVTLPANAATPLATVPRARWIELGLRNAGAFAVLESDGAPMAQHRLFVERFGDLQFARPEIGLEMAEGALILTSDVFAWGVCLDVDGELPLADNCFDLLPGIPYRVPWTDGAPAPPVRAIGNRDAVLTR
jgi:beta-mannosidase